MADAGESLMDGMTEHQLVELLMLAGLSRLAQRRVTGLDEAGERRHPCAGQRPSVKPPRLALHRGPPHGETRRLTPICP
jgi:hypothetical protein